jgi:hypothetical protein
MRNKHLGIVLLVAIVSVLVFWTPFKLKIPNVLGVTFAAAGMERIVQNFDGLNFLIVAKTGYDPILIEQNYQDILSGRRPLYFSAHYPGLPLLISLFDTFVSGPNAVLFSILTSNILLALCLFWFFDWYTKDSKIALWLSLFALFLPARMLAVRSVGSNEMLFIFFALSSLLLHERQKRWGAALMGSLAVLTRSPGILLFGAYLIHYLLLTAPLGKKLKLFYPYILIPLSLLGLWVYYGVTFGSFWAYFQVGGNINLYYPFAVFASNMPWVGEIWTEDIIYLTVFMVSGIYLYIKKKGWGATSLFAVLYALFTLCVAHRDLARYSLPIMPIIIAGWSEIVPTKLGKWIAWILIIPVFLYAWQFVLSNYQPVMDWAKYL